jgi:hypothetical protein
MRAEWNLSCTPDEQAGDRSEMPESRRSRKRRFFMSANDFNEPLEAPRTRSHGVVLGLLGVGLALALAANVYQYKTGEHLSRDIALTQKNTEKQIAKMRDAASVEGELNQQRFDAMKTQLEGSTAATLRQARSEVKRSSTQLAASMEQKHQEQVQKQQEVASQLSDLKQDTSSKLQDTNSHLEETSSKLQDTSAKLDQVSGEVEKTGSELRRVVGDMGVMSGSIATNSKELSSLKELGERNYFEFDLSKAKTPQKVADIRLEVKKTDPKRNRFTLAVYADDKMVEKKDRTINEPVQLYVSGNRQPYEIVVNEVKKNEVVGYLATPKVKTGRSQSATAGL